MSLVLAAPPRQPLNVELRNRMHRKRMSDEALARLTGASRAQVYKAKQENKWWKARWKPMADALLDGMSKTEGEETFAFDWYRDTTSDPGQEADPVAAQLAVVNNYEVLKMSKGYQELSCLTERLVDCATPDTFCAVNTVSVVPYAFRPRSRGEFVRSIYGAIRRGMLYMLIVPEQEHVDTLRRRGYDELHNADEFDAAFGVFRAGLEAFLQREAGMGAEEAREVALTRTGLYHTSEFDLTGLGYVQTLFGQRRPDHTVLMRLLTVSPYRHFGNLRALPDTPTAQGRMHRYVLGLLDRSRAINMRLRRQLNAGRPDPMPGMEGPPVEDTERNDLNAARLDDLNAVDAVLTFENAFRDRMRGDDDAIANDMM